MTKVMPTQLVTAIDQIFPHAKSGPPQGFGPGVAHSLRAVLNLANAVPAELINVPPGDYVLFVRAMTTIDHHIAIWLAHGSGAHGGLATIDGPDAIMVIRRVMSLCHD